LDIGSEISVTEMTREMEIIDPDVNWNGNRNDGIMV